MFAIFKQCFGWMFCFFLSWEGRDLLYVCCHMRMLCVALAESDWLRGGGRGEQQAWTPPSPHQEKIILGESMFI